jgi:hypothetical protein
MSSIMAEKRNQHPPPRNTGRGPTSTARPINIPPCEKDGIWNRGTNSNEGQVNFLWVMMPPRILPFLTNFDAPSDTSSPSKHRHWGLLHIGIITYVADGGEVHQRTGLILWSHRQALFPNNYSCTGTFIFMLNSICSQIHDKKLKRRILLIKHR